MAFSLRKNSDGGTIGLDIDGRFLAAAQMRDGQLVKLVSKELPPGVLADGEVVDREALSAAIKDFADEAKLPRDVQLGVSNQQIVIRVLEMPRIDDPSERDAALRFQAAEAIAMPLDEAILDHQVAGYVSQPDGGERMQVVVVAARRTMIEEYMAAVKDAGLKPTGIDLDAFALVRMLANEAPAVTAVVEPSPVAVYEPADAPAPEDPSELAEEVAAELPEGVAPGLAEIAPGAVDELAVAEPDEPTASEPVPAPIAPAPMPAPVESIPDVADTTPTARVLCHLGGVTNLAISVGSSCFFSRALSTSYDADGAGSRLADEIRMSIDYYMAQPNALGVGDVLLSGEGTRNQALVAEIGAQLGIPVAAAAPLGPLDASAVPNGDDPSRYTVAAGLAMGAAA